MILLAINESERPIGGMIIYDSFHSLGNIVAFQIRLLPTGWQSCNLLGYGVTFQIRLSDLSADESCEKTEVACEVMRIEL